MEERKKWEELSKETRQKKTADLIKGEVGACQTMLVSEMLKEKPEMWDNLKNWGDRTEVFEWWVVCGWLADDLEEAGEVILEYAGSIWWGRQCTGQAIKLDGVMQNIARKLYTR